MNNIIYQCRVTNPILIDVSPFLKNGDNGVSEKEIKRVTEEIMQGSKNVQWK